METSSSSSSAFSSASSIASSVTSALVNSSLSLLNSSSSSTGGERQATSPSDGLFSTDFVFLYTVSQIWLQTTIWTMVGCAAVFLCASIHALRVNTDHKTSYFCYLLVPLLAALFGGFIGFTQGGVTAALIGAVAVSIGSSIGIDIAAGLGLGQAIVIVYFHLGRADFIHR